MSTKITLAHGDRFHFYNEVCDHAHVYLELNGFEFKATHSGVTVQIPLDIWALMHRCGPPKFGLAPKTDEEMLASVESDVDHRIQAFENARTDRERAMENLFGHLTYGEVSDPRVVQIERGLELFRIVRARERAIIARIEEHEFVMPLSENESIGH